MEIKLIVENEGLVEDILKKYLGKKRTEELEKQIKEDVLNAIEVNIDSNTQVRISY